MKVFAKLLSSEMKWWCVNPAQVHTLAYYREVALCLFTSLVVWCALEVGLGFFVCACAYVYVAGCMCVCVCAC